MTKNDYMTRHVERMGSQEINIFGGKLQGINLHLRDIKQCVNGECHTKRKHILVFCIHYVVLLR